MSGRRLRVVHVNAWEVGGGAERVARQLVRHLRVRGHEASLLVGRGEPRDPYSHAFPSDAAARAAHLSAGPLRILDRRRGIETFRYPASRRILDTLPAPPDLVHLHNLHGGYFDLEWLTELSRRHAVAMTLHDAWLLSGHCAHSFDCERWRTGCGGCPDLGIYPAIARDATARNWSRKREIFSRSRVHVATPSTWLAERVRDSILEPALASLEVIPNGVELDVFHPGDRRSARAGLGLPPEDLLILTPGPENNPFKDFSTASRAVARASELLDREITLLVLGGQRTASRVGKARVVPLPFERDDARLARYYRASDLYLHAARADTFPTGVIEALACGVPVVASAVGGIPEQVRSYAPSSDSSVQLDRVAGADSASRADSAAQIDSATPPDGTGADEANGVLFAAGEVEAAAQAIARLLGNTDIRDRLGENAARHAVSRFDAAMQVIAYEAWYQSIVADFGKPTPTPVSRAPLDRELGPSGREGWPWTAAPVARGNGPVDPASLPRITVVTPSYNQAAYLEETIRSVLLQGYPNLEYIVVDGGSTDGSVEIIRRYEGQLAWWVSEPDRGQSHAINKGLERATGEIFAYLNSDDLYEPGALLALAERFRAGAVWVAGKVVCFEEGRAPWPVPELPGTGLARWFLSCPISQPGVFWSADLHRRVGPFREDLHYTMDWEFWLRLRVLERLEPSSLDRVVARYRMHPVSKTVGHQQAMGREVAAMLGEFVPALTGPERARLWLARRHRKGRVHGARAFAHLKDRRVRPAAGELMKAFGQWPLLIVDLGAFAALGRAARHPEAPRVFPELWPEPEDAPAEPGRHTIPS